MKRNIVLDQLTFSIKFFIMQMINCELTVKINIDHNVGLAQHKSYIIYFTSRIGITIISSINIISGAGFAESENHSKYICVQQSHECEFP